MYRQATQCLQFLLAQLANDTSRGKTAHSNGLGHGLERRRAIADSKNSRDISGVERRTGLDETLLGHFQSKLLDERAVELQVWHGNLSWMVRRIVVAARCVYAP
jgi:hypothetical protein